MSNSMISTVLEIEREAESVLAKAAVDAASMISSAQEGRAAASVAAEQNAKKEIADLEAKAAAEREAKVRELTVTGDAALSVVRNISDAAYESGVKYVLDALS